MFLVVVVVVVANLPAQERCCEVGQQVQGMQCMLSTKTLSGIPQRFMLHSENHRVLIVCMSRSNMQELQCQQLLLL